MRKLVETTLKEWNGQYFQFPGTDGILCSLNQLWSFSTKVNSVRALWFMQIANIKWRTIAYAHEKCKSYYKYSVFETYMVNNDFYLPSLYIKSY
jgi:hypothetical protein